MTIPTAETEEETEETTTRIQSNKIPVEKGADLEFYWFIILLTMIFTTIGIFLIGIIIIFSLIWQKQWMNQGYFKRNPDVNQPTKSRPVNQDSWFYLG